MPVSLDTWPALGKKIKVARCECKGSAAGRSLETAPELTVVSHSSIIQSSLVRGNDFGFFPTKGGREQQGKPASHYVK